MKTFIRKMGNSQAVLIPKPLLEQIGVAAGDAVDLKINKKGRLVIAPLGRDSPCGMGGRMQGACRGRRVRPDEAPPGHPGDRDW